MSQPLPACGAARLVTRFPDLTYLKRVIHTQATWPTVLMNAPARQLYRPDIPGPFSIFTNTSGTSHVRSGSLSARVPTGTYAITNAGTPYTLEVEGKAASQNIHVGVAVLAHVYDALVTPEDRLLDAASSVAGPVHFVPRLYLRDPLFDAHMQRVFGHATQEPEGTDEALACLLKHVLCVHRNTLAEMARVPATRAVTRVEVYRRLARSLDLLHATFRQPISLDDLAATACLSKYHYLRAFGKAFGETPYAYLTRIRLETAQRLLSSTTRGIAEIGMEVGYEEASVFSRAFRRRVGVSPAAYRAARSS